MIIDNIIQAIEQADNKNKLIAVHFAEWIYRNEFTKRKHSHPKYEGKWFSYLHDELGYMDIEDLYEAFVKDFKSING